MHQLGRHIGGDADVAVAAAQHERHCGGVVARVNRKTGWGFLDQPLGAFNIASGFLDADDAGHVGQADHGVVRHIGHRAAGHVVQHHGQIYRLGNRLEMLVLAFLRGFVVVGHHLQLAVGADFFGKVGQLNGFFGGIGAAAGHHRHAASALFDRHADDFAVFVHVDRG